MSLRLRLFVLCCAALLAQTSVSADGESDLVVYPAVPGLPPSAHYVVRVRTGSDRDDWKSAFAWETSCKTIPKKSDAYFEHLAGWTHTYVNFETKGAVEVEISRVDGQPIRSAVVHPKHSSTQCNVQAGKALVRLEKPCLVAVDIDGQMDERDTGKGYNGPPIHTISLFANPPLVGKPTLDAPGVLAVKPGEIPPSDGPWTTLYFLPGIHDLGLAFPLHAKRQYYIPGDSIVYGTFVNKEWNDGQHIRIFGHGTLSGAHLKNPEFIQPTLSEAEVSLYHPIDVKGARDTKVEGLTLADSAYHSVMLIHSYEAGHPNIVSWTKIFTWRANGDGINPFGNTLVEDCFIRTQDDSLYVNGVGIRRTVLWNDANGSSFVLTAMPQLTDRKLVVEDCDVIYSRSRWHQWSGGRVFNVRGEGGGPAGEGVIFRNIRIEDPRPTLQQFFMCMTVPEPYSKSTQQRKPGAMTGVLFQNISIAAPSVLNEPQLLWGQPDARIGDLTFENLMLGGKPILERNFFKTNEFVGEISFLPKQPGTP
ncbi:MAG: endo-polygalacturonase [Verrucomicrobiota bacterium]